MGLFDRLASATAGLAGFPSPDYADSGVHVYCGHVIDVLDRLPGKSVQCVVTSPPYWGLRAYSTEPAVWGGAAGCEHEFGTADGASCVRCGAWRGELGLETAPDLYIAHLVSVFRRVRRVLRDDGVLWVNIGDTYTSGGRSTYRGTSDNKGHQVQDDQKRPDTPPGLKPKDLVGVPWMLAFALRADGWFLRQDIIWHRTNQMPECVTDRCTRSHEYVFLLSKSERYYFDHLAIRQPQAEASLASQRGGRGRANKYVGGAPGQTRHHLHQPRGRDAERSVATLRNARDVRSIATVPFKGGHFAAFPPALVEPCVLAGTPAMGCCARCGSPVTPKGRSCGCRSAGTAASVVLDPFAGSGTTLAVAKAYGRSAVGIELNPAYVRGSMVRRLPKLRRVR